MAHRRWMGEARELEHRSADHELSAAVERWRAGVVIAASLDGSSLFDRGILERGVERNLIGS